MWFLRSGSCSGLVGRNQLWHSCTNGPFTGQINQATPGLGQCPESTVWRESHLTPLHWLKGATIITLQHSPGLSFSTSSIIVPPPGCILLRSSSSFSPALVPLTHSNLADCHQEAVIWGEMSYRPLLLALKSVVTVSYYIVYLPEGGGSCTLTIFKSTRSTETTSPYLASWGWHAGYNAYCYSSVDWLENEDQMEKVIMDVEMFMTRNKQELALKYHKSKTLPWNSIWDWNVLSEVLLMLELLMVTGQQMDNVSLTSMITFFLLEYFRWFVSAFVKKYYRRYSWDIAD